MVKIISTPTQDGEDHQYDDHSDDVKMMALIVDSNCLLVIKPRRMAYIETLPSACVIDRF